jgi:threonyl-tRNA synthetase
MDPQITLTMPDGGKKLIPKGTKLQDIAEPEAIAAQVNGRLLDLSRMLEEDASVSFVSIHSKKGLEILRHSAAHVMAQAVNEAHLRSLHRYGILLRL